MRISGWAVLDVLLAGPIVLFALAAPAPAAEPPALSLHAFAMNFTGVGSGGSGDLDIVIERWSTDEERDALKDALAVKGGGALLPALQKMTPRAGTIQVKPRMGREQGTETTWDVQFARSAPLPDGGRRVVLATGRPLSKAERTRYRRSADYEFLLVDIRLDKNGKGEGKTADGTRVIYNKETGSLEVEKYAVAPVKLIKIQAF